MLVICYHIDDHTVVIFYQQLAFYGHYEPFEITLKVQNDTKRDKYHTNINHSNNNIQTVSVLSPMLTNANNLLECGCPTSIASTSFNAISIISLDIP